MNAFQSISTSDGCPHLCNTLLLAIYSMNERYHLLFLMDSNNKTNEFIDLFCLRRQNWQIFGK
jgi:hypothetical protein